jgi:hypothetical protein
VPPIGSRRAVNTVQLGRVTPVDPLAPRVPERTIGVSVAPTPASVAPRTPTGAPPERTGSDPGSAFGAVQPQEQYAPSTPATHAQATSTAPQPVVSAPSRPGALDPGQVRCRVCGNPVGADRRFCRCGASLVPAVTRSTTKQAPARLPWYKRLGDVFGGNRDFRRSMRSANRGLRSTYNVGLSIRAKFVRASLLLGAAGVGLSQLGPWGGDLRGQLRDRVDRVVPHSYVDVPVDVVTTDPASRALPGYDPKFAVDGDPGRAWAAPWRPTADTGGPCRRSGGTPALLVTFPQPATVSRLTIRAGLAAGADERTRQAQPRVLDIQFSDGSCQPVELANTPDAQQFKVTTGSSTSARIVVADVYPAPESQGTPLVSLSEITFQRRK